MAIQYTAQAGDTANSIAAAHGFSNYQTAGISAPASGNYDKLAAGEVLTIGNATAPGQAAPVSTAKTPTVISSNDAAGQFATNSTSLNNKTTATYTTPSGAVVDATGKIITPAPTDTNADGTPKTEIEKAAAKGAGTGGEPNVTTGNPIIDSLQAWEKTQDEAAQQKALQQKSQIATMLQTNLAANDAQAAASIQNITNTYAGLIDTQTRINNLNINRTKAYGLASGNALATPLEFTNAVSQKETEAMTAIQKLDDQRDSLIATAKAAQASGDAKLLQDSMDAVDKAESNMQATLASLANEVTNRASLLNQVEKEQKDAQAVQSQKMLAAGIAQYGSQYGVLTDDKQKDAMVKQIVAASGGLLDYGTVFTGLEGAKSAAAAAATKKAQDTADLAKTKAQTNQANASAAVDWAKSKNGGNTPSDSQNFYTKVDKLLQGKDPSNGASYMDENGYINPTSFKDLLTAAGEANVTKEAFLKQYGGKLYPGANNTYPGYGLTGADVKTLTGIVTYIPPVPAGN